MVAKIKTVAFTGIKIVDVIVEVKLSSGIVAFNIVGLPNKSVNEAKERIRAAIHSIGLIFPGKRIAVNLNPADLNKDGGYLDLPMALGILVEMKIIKQEKLDNFIVLGELSLDGTINNVNGILPAAIGANERNLGIICPKNSGNEALWAGEDLNIVAVDNLLSLINFLNGIEIIQKPVFQKQIIKSSYLDFKDIQGQQLAKRALEIAAAGEHNVLMIGPPGTGKSMLAERIPSILPDLTLKEILEINIINSIAGKIVNGELTNQRPFLTPHHSCSIPALVGGDSKPKPGQITLAHNGILFLDELPEFTPKVLDSLRQPLEKGEISIARASQNVTYPSSFQLIAAMNPCRCGYYGDATKQCKRSPFCAQDYQNRISGPLLDRIDLFIDVGPVNFIQEKNKIQNNETSMIIKSRVVKARQTQEERYKDVEHIKKTNAKASPDAINKFMKLDDKSNKLIELAHEKYGFSLRTYNKIIKIARTIADLASETNIKEQHIAEALMFKQTAYLIK